LFARADWFLDGDTTNGIPNVIEKFLRISAKIE